MVSEKAKKAKKAEAEKAENAQKAQALKEKTNFPIPLRTWKEAREFFEACDSEKTFLGPIYDVELPLRKGGSWLSLQGHQAWTIGRYLEVCNQQNCFSKCESDPQTYFAVHWDGGHQCEDCGCRHRREGQEEPCAKQCDSCGTQHYRHHEKRSCKFWDARIFQPKWQRHSNKVRVRINIEAQKLTRHSLTGKEHRSG